MAPFTRWWKFSRKDSDKAVLVRIDPDRTGQSPGHELAVVTNSKYGFVASRPSAERPWVLRNVSQPDRTSIDSDYCQTTFGYADAAFAIFGIPFVDICSDAGFKVKRIERDEDHVKIEFDYRPKQNQNRLSTDIRGGSIVFLTNHQWAIEGYEVLFDKDVKQTISVEYDGELPKRILSTLHYPDGINEEYLVFTITEYDIGRLSDSDFTLTHFGLPEIGEGATPRSLPWLLPLNIFAVICLAAAIFFRRYASRASRPT
jgi:hypothetical protein